MDIEKAAILGFTGKIVCCFCGTAATSRNFCMCGDRKCIGCLECCVRREKSGTKPAEIKMKFQPRDDFLLVSPIKEDAMVGGVILAEDAIPKPTRGKVVAAGGKCCDCEVGDTIVFGIYAGDEFELDRVQYRIMRETDVKGRIIE